MKLKNNSALSVSLPPWNDNLHTFWGRPKCRDIKLFTSDVEIHPSPTLGDTHRHSESSGICEVKVPPVFWLQIGVPPVVSQLSISMHLLNWIFLQTFLLSIWTTTIWPIDYLEAICPWFCLQNKVFSNQNNGHLGSRYAFPEPRSPTVSLTQKSTRLNDTRLEGGDMWWSKHGKGTTSFQPLVMYLLASKQVT